MRIVDIDAVIKRVQELTGMNDVYIPLSFIDEVAKKYIVDVVPKGIAMRLIDADKLKIDHIEEDETSDDVYVYRYVSETQIDNAPTIEIPQWIPCEKELPKVGEEVLCQCRANIIEVLCLNERGFWENPSSLRHYFNSFVIAWMPLPEPYKEVKG